MENQTKNGKRDENWDYVGVLYRGYIGVRGSDGGRSS